MEMMPMMEMAMADGGDMMMEDAPMAMARAPAEEMEDEAAGGAPMMEADVAEEEEPE